MKIFGCMMLIITLASCYEDDCWPMYYLSFKKNDPLAIGTMTDQHVYGGSHPPLNECTFSKPDWFFAGWALNTNGKVKYADKAVFPVQYTNETLYAIWSDKQYTISFDTPAEIVVPSQLVAENGLIVKPSPPVSAGSNFLGWFIDSSYTTSWNFTNYTVTSNVTLYSKWENILFRDMVAVPGGTFIQEDTGGNNFQHTISGFQIGKCEVTYMLWYHVYTWATNNGYYLGRSGSEGGNPSGQAPTSMAYYPVTSITWRDKIVWCNAYSEMNGLEPIYHSESSFNSPLRKTQSDYSCVWAVDTTPGSLDNPYVNWNGNGYRLPTEGEWQYAARYRDGTSWTPPDYASGATADTTDIAATTAVACPYITNVGSKAPNQLGIYDMSGNVYESFWNWYGTWPTTPQTNYRGADLASSNIYTIPSSDLSLFRYKLMAWIKIGSRSDYDQTASRGSAIGFRVARK